MKPWIVRQATKINGAPYAVNDTVWLAETEALPRLGLSLERAPGNTERPMEGQAGEYREKRGMSESPFDRNQPR